MATPSPKHLIESTEEVEAWFESKGLMDEEEPCTPEEAMSMRDFLVSADGRTNLTAQDTAIRLMTVPTNRDDMTDSGPKAFRIASLILDVQLQFEAQQILTLDLIDAINDMTEPGGLSASVKQRLHDISWECCTTAHSKWEELTSDAWRSAWAWRYEPIEDETEDDVINKWTAINALFANRCARSLEYTLSKKDESRISHTGLGDLGTIGLGQVVQSLEQEPWKRRPEKLPQGASDKKWKEFNIQNLDVRAFTHWSACIPTLIKKFLRLNFRLRFAGSYSRADTSTC